MSRAVVALALAGLLVLAGCHAPVESGVETTPTDAATTTSGTTTTQSTDPATESGTTSDAPTTTADEGSTGGAIEVRDGTLPFNASRVFDRITGLLGVDVPPPDVIDVQRHEQMQTDARGLPPFAQTMGIGDGSASSREVAAAGITRGANYVALNERLVGDEARARSVLVHEFVHVVQYRRGSIDTAYENVQPGSTDAQMAYLSVVEGVPVFVEGAYHEAYDTQTDGMREMVRGYRNADGVHKYALAPYAFGARYAAARAGDVSNVSTLYEHPPKTTEAVIHHYAPGEEPVRSLRSNISSGQWSWSGRDRLGELFVRQVLVTELSEDRASTAAAGWGVDRKYTFTRENETAYVWALRWDSVRDADEFQNATRAYLADRGERRDGAYHADGTAYRLVRTSPEVVVLVVGPDAFVDGTRVDGTNETVSIQTGAASQGRIGPG